MEKLIYTIELLDRNFTKEQMSILNKIEPTLVLKPKTLEEFTFYSSDNGYTTKEEDPENYKAKNNAIKILRHTKYMDNYNRGDSVDIGYVNKVLNGIDLEDFSRKINIPFKVISSKILNFAANQTLDFSKSFRQLEELSNSLNDKIKDVTFNQKCDVHISGNMLLTINDLILIEDSCTDEIQIELNNGWRIVAVCVQPQRRPDYILGRYNPNLKVDDNRTGAKRK